MDYYEFLEEINPRNPFIILNIDVDNRTLDLEIKKYQRKPQVNDFILVNDPERYYVDGFKTKVIDILKTKDTIDKTILKIKYDKLI